jgi:hypothetical protein
MWRTCAVVLIHSEWFIIVIHVDDFTYHDYSIRLFLPHYAPGRFASLLPPPISHAVLLFYKKDLDERGDEGLWGRDERGRLREVGEGGGRRECGGSNVLLIK